MPYTLDRWEPKEAPFNPDKPAEVKKDCTVCGWYDKGGHFLCSCPLTCGGYSQWKPKEATEEWKNCGTCKYGNMLNPPSCRDCVGADCPNWKPKEDSHKETIITPWASQPAPVQPPASGIPVLPPWSVIKDELNEVKVAWINAVAGMRK